MVQFDRAPKRRKRRWGPIVVGLLFLFAAIGISIDHFANYFRELSRYSDRSPSSLEEGSDARSDARTDTSFEKQMIGRTATGLPGFDTMPEGPERRVRNTDTSSITNFEEPLKMAQPREPAASEISLEAPKEDLKISLDPSTWKGGPQLLPNPLSISSVEGPRRRDIRGGGWVVIDVANSKIEPVELFKNPQRGVIEARYLDGRNVVNPSATGFPVVRGIPGLNPGGFEVFENPPCVVRYSGVSETEICEVRWKNIKLHFKFEAPVLAPEEPAPDFIFTTVSIDVGPGDLAKARWQPVVSFNESFHPIGDVNRDGYPDFYVESVTAADESGVQHLAVSSVIGDDRDVTYTLTTTRFRPRR